MVLFWSELKDDSDIKDPQTLRNEDHKNLDGSLDILMCHATKGW